MGALNVSAMNKLRKPGRMKADLWPEEIKWGWIPPKKIPKLCREFHSAIITAVMARCI